MRQKYRRQYKWYKILSKPEKTTLLMPETYTGRPLLGLLKLRQPHLRLLTGVPEVAAAL